MQSTKKIQCPSVIIILLAGYIAYWYALLYDCIGYNWILKTVVIDNLRETDCVKRSSCESILIFGSGDAKKQGLKQRLVWVLVSSSLIKKLFMCAAIKRVPLQAVEKTPVSWN